jgi:hypothetical protein
VADLHAHVLARWNGFVVPIFTKLCEAAYTGHGSLQIGADRGGGAG